MTVARRVTIARRGFSLMELLIVIIILLALGGIVLVGYLNVADQADVDLQRVQFDQIDQAMKRFKLDLKRWPSEEEGLTVLWSRDALEEEDDQTRWRGPYLETPIRADNWGSELVYRYPSEEMGEGFYDIVSFGPDREEGTEDDITNHDRLRDEEGEIGDEFDDFDPGGGLGDG
jgi:general secretion pathway protein G